MLTRIRQIHGLVSTARAVRAQCGKPILTQALECLRLLRGRGRLGPSEYYDYRLYDDNLHDWASKSRFVGQRGLNCLYELLVDGHWEIVSHDKLTLDALMRAHGFPLPRLLGVYHPGGRRVTVAPVLRDSAALAAFLTHEVQYPFYAKPAHGIYGRRNFRVDAIDRAAGRLLLGDGESIDVAQFGERLGNPSGMGYLFQEVLRPHPEIAALTGGRLCGARIYVVVTPDGPKLHRAVWKIASGANAIDNFQHGASGNLLADIDRKTGEVVRIIGGTGAGLRENPPHPDTGATIVGFRLPEWREIVDLVLRAATVLPGYFAQGWDIALCDRGPVLLEVNMVGDVDLPQFAGARGFLDDSLVELCRERARRLKKPPL